jgi:acyl transferase domain-containing protein/acyl carrier protein
MNPSGSETTPLDSVEALHAWLISRLSMRLGIDPQTLDIHERFNRYGLDSAQATSLLAELAEVLGRRLSPTLIWDHPTVQALATQLGNADQKSHSPSTPASFVSLDEPIAVVGLACRFPGADDPAAFWRLLCSGTDAVSEIPASRWDLNTFYDADLKRPGKMNTRCGGFLKQIDLFDAPFFGISPREAIHMDPQQRLMLELAWEALEDGGVPAESLSGSSAGVFIGAMWSDYARRLGSAAQSITQHTATGQDTSIIAARVSYFLGLQGPSLVVNTACSSSLVAVHLACQSLRSGEVHLALAGGVNLLLAPETTVAMSKFGAMAPDGRSKAFDARANGYVRGEGGGMVVLKPLSRALADGDIIYCVIRGSAVNNDGFSNGLAAPNPRAQEEVLQNAYRRAGVSPQRVHYVETHGTGTFLGDPIEAGALGTVLGSGRPVDAPLYLGSVKTNIGHLEAAAGIAGLIKTALCLRHRTLPPTLHFEQPNPHIPFEDLRLKVQAALTPWPPTDEPPLAGVSSFGFGGTNCHIVLEGLPTPSAQLFPFAAENPAALRALAQMLHAQLLQSDTDATLADWCYSAATQVSQDACRAALLIQSKEELAKQLEFFLSEPNQLTRAHDERRGPVFVFSGNGSQWLGMGSEAMRHEPVFRAALQACDSEFRSLAGWSILEELTASANRSRLQAVEVSQPVLFSIQVALAALWRSWGIEPSAVVGHSVGEIAAAYVAGSLMLAQAVQIVFHRSRLQQRLAGRGGMMMVELPSVEVEHLLMSQAAGLALAACNSHTSTVVSGTPAALEAFTRELEQQQVNCRMIRVDVAYHSPQMDELREELSRSLQGLNPRPGRLPIVSTVTGSTLDGRKFDSAYWVKNMREPVCFAQAIAYLATQGYSAFLELSPHPILTQSIKESLAPLSQTAAVLSSFRRETSERLALLESLGELYRQGYPVQWQAVYPVEANASVPISKITPSVESPVPEQESQPEPAELWPLSANTPEAARESARSMLAVLEAHPHLPLRDVCYTASAKRSHRGGSRLAVVARSTAELRESLRAFLHGQPCPEVSFGQSFLHRGQKLVFVFPGQGSQWIGMGRDLLENDRVFRATLEDCDQALRAYVDWSLLEILTAPETQSRLNEIDVIQPVLFAMQVALAAVWRSWGVYPAAVVGHSMGEVAAAHVAGVLSLDEALRVICRRSQLLKRISGRGAMAVVGLSLEQARAAVVGYEADLSVAVSNGPASTVLSGDPAALEKLLASLQAQNIFCRPVQVNVASHSPQVDCLRDDLFAALAGLQPQTPTLPIYSTVTARAEAGTAFDADYWVRNLRQPVLFSTVMQHLLERGHGIFIEVSPHPVLMPAMEEMLRATRQEGRLFASLRRDREGRSALLESLGSLYTSGYPVEWQKLYPAGGRRVSLPNYSWQRERYWIEDDLQSEERQSLYAASRRDGKQPLLGNHRLSSVQPGQHFWDLELSLTDFPQLADHRVRDQVVLPATVYVEMALLAARQVFSAGSPVLEQVEFPRALFLSNDSPQTLQLVISVESEALASFQLSSLQGDLAAASASWVLHARGQIQLATDQASLTLEAWLPPPAVQASATVAQDAREHYQAMQIERHLHYGPGFQGIDRLWRNGSEAVARLRPPELIQAPAESSLLQSVLLDAGLQTLVALLPREAAQSGQTYVPVGLGKVMIHAPLTTASWSQARLNLASEADPEMFTGDVRLLDEEGHVLAEARSVRLQRLDARLFTRPRQLSDLIHTLQWQRDAELEVDLQPGTPAPGHWLILADAGGVGQRLADYLESLGEPSIIIFIGENSAFTEAQPARVNPHRLEDFTQALQAALTDGQRSCRGVIYAWSLDVSVGEADQTAIDHAQALTCRGLLSLFQSLLAFSEQQLPPLYLITRGAQAVLEGESEIAIFQSPIWGMARVLTQEHPELSCKIIDLPPATSEVEIHWLCNELRQLVPETQVAFRSGARYVARLARNETAIMPVGRGDAKPLFQPEATYLITGGLGGLGLQVAQWMVAQGARHLALIGRNPPSDSAEVVLQTLRRQGAQVAVLQADVADRSQMAEVLQAIEPHFPPLRGCLHAAGVLSDGLLRQLSWEQFERVMQPKMMGAWVLHELTQDKPLDFFILFSSASALIGFPGQANYAAANVFLDALAHYRQAQGLPALSINWGPWAEVGLAAATTQRGERLAQRGVESLQPEEGLRLLEQLMRGNTAQAGVFPFDLSRWSAFYPVVDHLPYFTRLRHDPTVPAQGHSTGFSLRESLEAADPPHRRVWLEDYLREQVAQALRCTPERIHRQAPLGNLGVDSLLGLEIRNRLEAASGLSLPVTLLWNYPTLADLAAHLAEQLAVPLEITEQTLELVDAAWERNPTRDYVESLSDQEAEALLLQELERLKSTAEDKIA